MTVALAVSEPTAPADREIDDLTLARARRGEAAACRELVLRYQRAVFAHLSRMVGARGGTFVEDLAQDTFLRVFRSLPGFSPGGPARLSTWILTIATRLALDVLRRERQPVALDDVGPLSSSLRTEAGAERREARARIERALATLTPEMRAAFLLRAYHEWSYEEIAEALELELGTVKSRIARARERLRGALEERHAPLG